MKAVAAVCFAAILGGCMAAHTPTQPVDQTLLLRLGQTVVPGTSLRLSFTDIADSRCPQSVVCVWEGDAAVRLESDAGAVVLHTSASAGSSTAKLADVTITLVGVLPPRLTPDEIKRSDYAATIRLAH